MDATSASSPVTEAPVRLRVSEWLRVAVLAALAGAIAAAAFDLTVAESVVDRAVDAEGAAATTAAPELFTRTEQRAGLALAELVFGIGIAMVLAGAAVLINPGRTARTVWLALMACCAWALVLLPAIKYPALPPGVEATFEIAERQTLYLVLVLVGIGAALAAAWVWERTEERRTADRVALAGLTAVVPAAVVMLVLPAQRVEGSPDADLVDDFRVVALAGQIIFWAVVTAVGLVLIARHRGERRSFQDG